MFVMKTLICNVRSLVTRNNVVCNETISVKLHDANKKRSQIFFTNHFFYEEWLNCSEFVFIVFLSPSVLSGVAG